MMTLDPNGFLTNAEGRRFIAVGANYWPASCGVEMWQQWPRDEILADLDAMAALGFNTVRFFLRWSDFEPTLGTYNETMWERLDWLLVALNERGLHGQPSLLIGWMSGGLFWPAWKKGSLFTDPDTIDAAEQFVRAAARRLQPHADRLAGVDLGNELNAIAECQSAPPAAVREWCRRMCGAVHDALPGMVVLSGCDHQQVVGDTGWRLGDQPGVDLLTMHGYPVPTWHPVPCGGLADEFTRSLLPFYVKCARAFGPVMLQEFGSILSSHPERADGYLRAILPACWRAGANGFLWWCFRDIHADVHPYVKNHFESELGLVGENRQVKPSLRYFVEFIRELSGANPPPEDDARPVAGLYWPKHYYDRDNPANPGNSPRETARLMLLAHHLLERLNFRVAIVRGDQPLSNDIDLLLIPGLCTDRHEIAALAGWVARGGRLWWHGPDNVNWGRDMSELIGATVADYVASTPAEVRRDGAVYCFDRYPRNLRLEVMPAGATVVANDDQNLPMILSHAVGRGRVLSVLADVEGTALADWHGHEARWTSWYAAMLPLLDVRPPTHLPRR